MTTHSATAAATAATTTFDFEPQDTVTWLTRAEAAAYLRLSTGTLSNWASGDVGPSYTRMGRGRVLYRLADIESWLAAQDRLCV
ncbi:helix-turn-helix transcriptional regulator [Specibacter sp. RAF43]|uniref:helix-turn-helix transcriptional regulator n=1 Tax=Specibacter sp. RAF43 TaxID=3233057 RepID=UPI003F9CC2A5